VNMVKAKIVKIVTKVRTSGDGSEYWIVHLAKPDGVAMPQHLCFDKQIKDKNVGDVVEFNSVEKNGTWFFNFPKTGGGGRQSYGAGAKSDLQVKGQLLLSMMTMTMSYAKDIVVAEINQGITTVGNPEDRVVVISDILKGKIKADPDFAGLMGLKGSGEEEAKEQTEDGSELRKALNDETKAYIDSLSLHGYELPADALEAMLKRFSGRRDAKGFKEGPGLVSEMTDAQVKDTWDRFKAFEFQECKGEPKACDKYSVGENGEPLCSWAVNCLYAKNTIQ